jgi:tripartite-type tricarboxylate transporter receptor subunit TctC
MGRPFVLPPDVPADRVAALRTAFQVMLKDPAFLAAASKLRLRVVATTGERMTALLADAYKTSPAIVQRTIKALGRGG